MAVTRRAVTTGVPANTTSFVVTLPAHVAGSRIIIAVLGKENTAGTPTITAGWTNIGRFTGGTGTIGNDTGIEVAVLFAKDAASSAESNPTVTGSGTAYNSWEWIAASYDPEAGKAWIDAIGASAPWVKSGSDTTTGSPLTATVSAWSLAQPTTGDAIFVVGGIPTDLGTALGATTLTATGLSGGTKSTATNQYVENSLGNDTAAVWADWTGFTGTASAGLATSFTVTGATNQSGVIVAVALRQGTPITPAITQAAYRIYIDGNEFLSNALAIQNAAPTVNLHGGDLPVGVRILLQETAGGPVPFTDDWQLQWEKNASGTWTNVTTGGTTAVAYDSASLTDGGATTSRLTGGTGTYVAGKVSEDGLTDDVGWSASDRTELLYSVTLKAADLADGDTLRFRVLKNGATTDLTYTQVPTINVIVVEPTIRVASSASAVATGGSGATVSKPTGTVDGDLLIAGSCSDGGGSSIPAGFTALTTSGFSGTVTLLWGYKIASSEGANYSFGAGADITAFVLRVTGHETTPTITQVAGVSVPTGGANAVAPGLTPAGSDDLLICMVSHDGDVSAAPTDDLNWTPPSTMTEHEDRHSGGWTCSSIASEWLLSGSATGTRTFDPISTNHRAGAAGTIAIKAGAAGPPTINAAAALTAVSTLTVTAFEENFATAALTAVSTLTVVGIETIAAAAALSATSTLTAPAVRTQLGTVSLSSASTLTAGAVRQPQGVAALTAAATLTVASVREPQAAASLVAASTLTSTAVITQFASVALTATASLAATATTVISQQATAALTGTSTLVATAAREPQASVSLTATSTLTTAAVRVPQGSAALVATSTLSAAADRTAVVAAALSTTSTLSATAVREPQAAASLVSTSTLTTSGVVTRFATTVLSASSTLTTAGVRRPEAVMALVATATLTTTATKVAVSAAALSATAILTATGIQTGLQPASAALVGTSTLTATAVRTTFTTTALVGTSTLTGAGVVTEFASVSLSSASTLTTAGMRVPQAAASLTAAGTLVPTATQIRPATVALTGVATLTTDALITKNVSTALTATSTLTTSAIRQPQAAASLTATATLTTTAARTATVSAALSATATLTATAIGLGVQLGTAALTASSTLAATALRTAPVTAALVAGSTLTVTGVRTPQAAASLTSTATLTVAGARTAVTTVVLTSSATLIATATTVGLVQGAVALTATGTLTIGTVRTQLGAATLTGVATLTTTAERIRPSTAELSATSTLTTVAIRQPQAAASLTATSTLTVVSVNELQAMATLSAEATLSVLAVRFPAAGVIQNAARTGTLYGLDPTSGWHSVQAIP